MISPPQPVRIERARFALVEAPMPPMPHHSLAVHLHGRASLEWQVSGQTGIARPMRGSVTVVPAGRFGQLRLRGDACEVLKITVPEALLAEAAGSHGQRHPELRDRLAIRDPLMAEIGFALLRANEQPATTDTLYREALEAALIAHLLRQHGAQAVPPVRTGRAHPLSEARARRAVAIMEAGLRGPLALRDLARELGLSVSHMSAQFRARFGCSPARYLAWLRLERARNLLARDELGIEQVARMVGYATPSHFAQAFRATYGITPSAYRRERRN